MPKVLFNIGFCPGSPEKSWTAERKNAWLDTRSFYTCNAFYNYFSYTTNNNKVSQHISEDTPRAYDIVASNNDKNANYMEKTSGVFNNDGLLSGSQKAELEKKLQNTKSNIWHGFISFDPETSPLIHSPKEAIRFINRNMGAYFKQTHLDEDNIESFYSLHSDTDNNHIHFCFFEKEAKYINCKGYKTYTKKGVFGKKIKDKSGKSRYIDFARDDFLISAELYFSENKAELAEARNREVEILKATKPEIAQKIEFKSLRSSLMNLKKVLPKTGHTSYNSKNMRNVRHEVNKCAKQLLDTMPKVRECYQKTRETIVKRTHELQKICKENDIPYYTSSARKTVSDLYTQAWDRLCNHVIKIAKSETYDLEPYHKKDLSKKICARQARRYVGYLMKTYTTDDLIDSFNSLKGLRDLDQITALAKKTAQNSSKLIRNHMYNINRLFSRPVTSSVVDFSDLHRVEYEIKKENKGFENHELSS